MCVCKLMEDKFWCEKPTNYKFWYRDYKLTQHLCNYGITEMPKQKQRMLKK